MYPENMEKKWTAKMFLKIEKKTYIHHLSESKHSRTVPTGDYSRLSPNEKALNGYLGI